MLYDALIETSAGMENVIFSSNGDNWSTIKNDAWNYAKRIFMDERIRLIHVGKHRKHHKF